MTFQKSLELLYPEVTIPQQFDERYRVVYALQAGIYAEMRDWILKSLTLEQKALLLKEIQELIGQDLDDYGGEGEIAEKLYSVQDVLTKNIINELEKVPVLTQLKMIPNIDVPYDFSKIIPDLKTEEEYHTWFLAVMMTTSTTYLKDIVESYTTQFTPATFKKFFTDFSDNKHLKSLLYYNLPLKLKNFLQQESFSATEILENFTDIILDGLTITDKVNVTDYIRNPRMNDSTSRYVNSSPDVGLLTLTDMATLHDLNTMHISQNVYNNLNTITQGMYTKMYENGAREHGFLGEFYRFVVTEGDKVVNKKLWDNAVKNLRVNVADYIYEHQEEASQWHPLIHAIIHGVTYQEDTSSEAMLESVMNVYIQKYHRIDIKNEKMMNQLLDVKGKNLHLKVWRNQYNITPEELNLTI